MFKYDKTIYLTPQSEVYLEKGLPFFERAADYVDLLLPGAVAKARDLVEDGLPLDTLNQYRSEYWVEQEHLFFDKQETPYIQWPTPVGNTSVKYIKQGFCKIRFFEQSSPTAVITETDLKDFQGDLYKAICEIVKALHGFANIYSDYQFVDRLDRCIAFSNNERTCHTWFEGISAIKEKYPESTLIVNVNTVLPLDAGVPVLTMDNEDFVPKTVGYFLTDKSCTINLISKPYALELSCRGETEIEYLIQLQKTTGRCILDASSIHKIIVQ